MLSTYLVYEIEYLIIKLNINNKNMNKKDTKKSSITKGNEDSSNNIRKHRSKSIINQILYYYINGLSLKLISIIANLLFYY